MALQLSPDGEYVDWRRFVLQAAQPWPAPSQLDLLDALAAMRQMDQDGTGSVTREQFNRVIIIVIVIVIVVTVILY